jgi:hypothetical protein
MYHFSCIYCTINVSNLCRKLQFNTSVIFEVEKVWKFRTLYVDVFFVDYCYKSLIAVIVMLNKPSQHLGFNSSMIPGQSVTAYMAAIPHSSIVKKRTTVQTEQ